MNNIRPSGPPAQPSARTAGRLLSYARPYLKLMLLALALIIGATLIVNALPMILQRAIDNYLLAPQELDMQDRFAGLRRMGALFLALAAIGYLLRMGQGLLTAWIGQSIVFDLRRDVFDKTLRLELPYFDRTPVGTLMTRVTSDVEAIQRFVTEGVVGLAADVCMLLGIAGYMVYLNPRLAGITALLLPPLVAMLETVNRRLRQANRDIRARQSELNAGLQEQLSGMAAIQLFNRQQKAGARFDKANLRLRQAYFEEVRWFSHFFPLIEIGQNGATALLVGVGGWLVLNAQGVMTVGMLVAFLAYVRNFFWPLGALSDKASAYQRAMAAAERIFELLATPEEMPDPPSALPLPSLEGVIRFEHVDFAYRPDYWVLRDFDLRIIPGETLAVVGATGAGKTTLVNLLARFYDVAHGRITINGHDIRDLPKTELRRRIGMVLQDPFVFAGTIGDNIGLNHPAVSRAEIERAARYVNAHRFIERLPRGYDTELRAQGGGLSSGEKQLLAMARALALQPAVVLVLDEATANVDSHTELLIQEALNRLMRSRTTIAIAHRLSTIQNADRILVMRHGRIAAQGSHEELMASDKYYRRLVDLLRIMPS